MDWLTEASHIMLIYYEKLLSDELKSTLSDTVSFMNMTINHNRLECTIKHSNVSFSQKEKCVKKEEMKPKFQENANIYSKKHIIWINSRIRTVGNKVKELGLDPSCMKNYENTIVKLRYCL